MFKVFNLTSVLESSKEPSWEIIKLIVQAQYSITAIGLMFIIGITAIIISVNWATARGQEKRAVNRLKSEMNKIKIDVEKLKTDASKIINREVQYLKGEKDRLFLLSAMQAKNWNAAVVWAGCAIEDFAKANNLAQVENMIEILRTMLNKSENIKGKDKKNLIERLKFIPDDYKDKRLETEDLINTLEVIDVNDEQSDSE